jgi:mannose-6-phosphate isomerase-like protein (cupin superfamily)
MNRRTLLQLPLLASALTLEAKNPLKTAHRKAFVLRAGEARYLEDLRVMGGLFDCKVSAKDTDGALCIFDTIRNEKGGPPLHFHYSQDELFYIIKGEFRIKVGEDIFDLKPGDFAFAPRMLPHTFAKTSDEEGHLLITFQPAGNMEDFFAQMAKFGKDIPKNQVQIMKNLSAAHGMKIVGPPLVV